VKWLSYGERENTWQKASDFSDPTIIDKYWKKHDELKRREEVRIAENKKADSTASVKKTPSLPTLSNEKSDATIMKVPNRKRELPATLSREERLLKRRAARK
jgi:hypothetical protein